MAGPKSEQVRGLKFFGGTLLAWGAHTSRPPPDRHPQDTMPFPTVQVAKAAAGARLRLGHARATSNQIDSKRVVLEQAI